MEKFLGLYTTRKKDNGEYEVVSFPIGERQIEIHDFTYSSPRMELPSLTANFFHKSCLDDLWSCREFVTFRGEKYFITKTPNSSKDNQDERYKYSVTFTSERSILSTTFFYDTVNKETDNVGTANKYCSNSSKVYFVGTILEFIPRLNASLKYSNIDYTVVLDVNDISAERLNESKEFSCENITNFDALKQAFNTWDIPFYFIDKECHFGYFDKSLDLTNRGAISYGCNNELLSIQRTNSSDKIVTRATGLGSSENIPFYYPNDSEKGNFIFEHTLSDLEIVDANKLANKVKDKEVYTYTDITKYPNIEVSNSILVVQHDLETGDKSEYTIVDGEPIYVGNLENLHKQRHDIIVEFELTNASQVSIDFIAHNDYENLTFSDAQFVAIEDRNSDNVVNYWSGSDGDTIYTNNVLEKGNYQLKISGLNVNKPYPLTNSYNYTVSLGIHIYGEPQNEYSWVSQSNDKISNLRKIGIAYDETLEDLGKTFRLEITELLPYQTNLMPSIFSRGEAFNGSIKSDNGTLGVERYYDAINNIYLVDKNDETVHYTNELNKYNRSENIYTFEDIKPQIEGIRNSNGELICEIIDVAYDDDDNDYTLGEEHGDSANVYSHPYFYIKIRKTDSEQGVGFNLFDHAIEGEEMTFQINSGNLNGCKFKVQSIETTNNVFKNPVQVDENGNLVSGNWQQKTSDSNFIASQQDTRNNEVWIVLLKEDSTFGILMPNVANNYKMDVSKPSNNTFNITGISLPKEYILAAERRLDDAIVIEMKEENSEKFKYSLDLSRIFLAKDYDVKQADSFFSKLNESSKIKISYNGKESEQYVSSYSYTCSNSESLPKVTIEVSEEITKKKTWAEKITNSAQQKAVVTATSKAKTIIKESNLATVKEVEEKAVKSNSLEGYGIKDVYIDEDGTIVIGNASVKPLTSGNNNIIDWNKVVSRGDFIELWKQEMAKWFAIDDANNGIYPVANRGFFSNSFISAKGISPNTGGESSSGLIRQVFGYNDLSGNFLNSDFNNTFNAYTIARLASRISYLEQNGGGSGSGGVADSIEWEKVLYKPSWLVDEKPSVSFFDNDAKYITSDALNPYATQQWVNDKGYATATDVANTYVAKTTFNTLKTDFDNLSALLNDDVQGKINTWHEVVDFLDEYSGSQDLAAILSGMNTDIASRVEKSKFAEYFSTEMAKWFVKDDTNRGIKPVNSYGLYSDTYVSAKGVSTGASGGGGGTSYDRLDSWAEYTSAKAGYVLSALLGQDLNTRLTSLESGSALSVTTSGSGNAVTGVSKSGNQLVITKGATFLTEHQSLAGYATTTALNNGLAGKQDKITNSNKLAYSLISGTPTSLPASDVAAWAKAASKPSYAFSEITNKPTTLGGYGITDAYTATTIDGKLSAYQPLSTAINTGNIGSQSVNYASSAGDADTLDGYHSTDFTQSQIDNSDNFLSYTDRARFQTSFISGQWDFCSLVIPTWTGNNANNWYLTELRFELGGNLKIRASKDGNVEYGWKTIATTESNVASATKLQTSRTIWGQSFDGTGDVSGHITNASSFRFSGDIGIWQGNLWSSLNTDDIAYYATRHAFWGNVGIGTASPSYKLHVDGTMYGDLKMKTPRTIWGQSFDGTRNVSGAMTGVDYIISNNKNGYFIGNRTDGLTGVTDGGLMLRSYGNTPISFHTNSSSRMKITGEGNILIGDAADSGHKLAVYGNAYLYDNAPTNDITTCLALGTNIVTTSAAGKGVGITMGLNNDRYYTKIATIFEESNPGFLNPAIAFYTMRNTYVSGSEVERMRITSAGNVGIGTTRPEYKLDVNGSVFASYSTNNAIHIGAENDVAKVSLYAATSGNHGMYSATKSNWVLYTDGTNTFLPIGNVGIGTTAPTEKLHVAGNIVATGSVTAKSSSDYRLKCAFDYNVDYQERLLSLGRVCDFNYTPHAQKREFAFADDKRHTSVIWQDAKKANITGFCSVEEDGYGTINPLSSDLIFTMVGAIQQGIVKTERIEERVVRLEKENRELKEKINLLEGGRYGC